MNPIGLAIAGRRWSPLAVVRHRGRRSGRPYVTPLLAMAIGSDLHLPLTYGPGCDWCQNVLAAGGCSVTWHGRTFTASYPEVVQSKQLLPSLPPAKRLASGFLLIRQSLRLRPGPPEQ